MITIRSNAFSLSLDHGRQKTKQKQWKYLAFIPNRLETGYKASRTHCGAMKKMLVL